MGRSALLAALSPTRVGPAVAAALGAAALAAQSPLLYAPAAADLGGAPRALLCADLDGDGDGDLVALRADAAALAVAQALGGGAYAAGVAVALPDQGAAFALADYDADGDVDAAVLAATPDVLVRLANDGAGNLAVASSTAALASPSALFAADLELDGDVDFCASSSAAPALGWWIGAGGGALGALQQLALPEAPSMAAVGDVDGDGFADFASARDGDPSQPAPPLRVRRGASGGGFALEIASNPFGPANVQAGRIALADLDQDGDADLVAATQYAFFVYTSASDGSGAFGPVVATNIGESGIGLGVADLDGDGWPDVASAQSSVALTAFNVLWGGAGGSSGIGKHHGVGFPGAVDLALGDCNGDGELDVAVALGPSGRASIHTNLGARDFADVDFPLSPFAAQGDVACVDWNLDGAADIATTTSSTLVYVYAGNGLGAQLPALSLTVPDPGARIAAGDLDGSGRADLVHLDATGGMQVLLSSGPGAFAPAFDAGGSSLVTALALGDVNQDGRLDVVTSDFGGARVFAGNGDGTLAAATTIALGAVQCERVAIADVDLNGIPDLVGLDRGTASIGIAKGAGAGAFGAPTSVAFGAPLLDFTAGHLDQDNKLDLVATATGANGVWVAQNDTTGGFLAAQPFALPGGGDAPVLFDANADGYADLLYAESAAQRPRLAFGDGSAQFTQSIALAESVGLVRFALGDLDADGRCEIVGTGARDRLRELRAAVAERKARPLRRGLRVQEVGVAVCVR
ncbi:MAG: VCBS repeat-containing protein, partial [Planctomycetota bacterium]